jgi:hypothetical protein
VTAAARCPRLDSKRVWLLIEPEPGNWETADAEFIEILL